MKLCFKCDIYFCVLFQEVEKYAKLVDSIQYNSQKVGMIYCFYLWQDVSIFLLLLTRKEKYCYQKG